MRVGIDDIKSLRERTGVSVMQCKKALEESGGDVEKALAVLRGLGAEAAARKAGRELGAGFIGSYVHTNGTVGAMVALDCETDFVAMNEDFRALARDLAMHVTASAPEVLKRERDDGGSFPEDRVLLEQPFVKDPEIKVSELIESAIQKFGEKIEIVDFVRMQI